jgi:hypothetical protein
MGNLEGRMHAMEGRVRDVQGKVDEIHRVMMQAQGGWRAMVLVGTISAALGAGLAKVVGLLGLGR